MHPELQEAIDLHKAIVAEAGKALVGYETEKALANVVLLSEIPTTYDKDPQRQVNAGNLLLRGVPGVGKTFFGVILAAISAAKFARIQGRADLQPTEVVGFDFKVVELKPLMSQERIIELRRVITREVYMHEALDKYIRRLVVATRPYHPETEWHHRSPSELVERCVELGASPRATICWGR